MSNLTVADVASVIAAVAAVFAAWYAFRGTQAARQSFGLALQQDAGRSAGLTVYFSEGRIHRYRSDGVRIYELQLRVTNLADVTNGLAELLLELELSRPTGPSSHIALKHDSLQRSTDPHFRDAPYELPVTLDPRQPRVGTAVFRTSNSLLAGMRVETYHVVAVDSHARRSLVRVIALNEVEHA